jgi:hypothetical protein
VVSFASCEKEEGRVKEVINNNNNKKRELVEWKERESSCRGKKEGGKNTKLQI